MYLDIKIPHLQIAHQGGNLEVGNILTRDGRWKSFARCFEILRHCKKIPALKIEKHRSKHRNVKQIVQCFK